MPPVSHFDLLVVLAFLTAITLSGFSLLVFLAYQWRRDSKRHFERLRQMTTAVGGMVYQEEAKTRALLREHGRP